MTDSVRATVVIVNYDGNYDGADLAGGPAMRVQR